ncbi:MAG: nucleotide sugar dehydrogenase [Pseudomonadota bacterium]
MPHFANLRDKLNNHTAVIGIIGLGYVGLPLVLRFAEVGFPVIGFDIDPYKTAALSRGESYFKHIPSKQVKQMLDRGGFSATTDFSRAAEADALILCVPTPLDNHREPDLSFIINTIEEILPHLRPGQVVSLESTTYPGTTAEVIRPRIEEKGFTVGQDAFVVFSPEREDPGNPHFTTRTIPKVVGGETAACLEIGKTLYGQVIDQVVPVSSTMAAEMTKLLENIFRSVNIGLVNELKIVADKMGIDIWEVINAAATKPFGYTPFYPGPGLGGHCIPIDPFYLTWKAREYGINTRFIELAGEVNTAMPQWVVSKVADALNDQGKALKGANVLVLGIAYKKNVDDMRESPSVEIMELLEKKGCRIAYSDPFVPAFPKMRKYQFHLKSVDLTPETLRQSDCVVLATNHDAFDYAMIAGNAPLIVDTRGVYREPRANVVKA